MIIYSKNSGNINAAIGKLETPIKMIIEHESDLLKKKGGPCDWLFNVEKSNRFGETIVGQNEFDVFQATEEGAAAPLDCINERYTKFIEHIQFMKEFAITAEAMEDANYGVGADTRRLIENFTRAYYKTRHKVCETALANATGTSATYAGATLDLTTPDGLPLFASTHKWGNATNGGTQSNFFYGNLFGLDGIPCTDTFEEVLSDLSIRLRNMKDENGDPLGYNADTIIIPGNKPIAETVVKKVCGTNGSLGGNENDINLHYGSWNIVVLPNWQPLDEMVMIMSSEANRDLAGNMFFNRVPLTINNWQDHHTGNYMWSGRCRFGIGFGTYKHILLAVNSVTDVSGATCL